MASKGDIMDEQKKYFLFNKYSEERTGYRKIVRSQQANMNDTMEAAYKLDKLPKNSCPTRLRRRCMETGNPRSYMRQFGLSRMSFSAMAKRGEIPGLKKASW